MIENRRSARRQHRGNDGVQQNYRLERHRRGQRAKKEAGRRRHDDQDVQVRLGERPVVRQQGAIRRRAMNNRARRIVPAGGEMIVSHINAPAP
jgi:hypothetical protein